MFQNYRPGIRVKEIRPGYLLTKYFLIKQYETKRVYPKQQLAYCRQPDRKRQII